MRVWVGLRRLPIFWVLVMGGQAWPLAAAAEAPSDYCEIAKNAIKEASLIRELAVKRSVPCLVHDKGAVRDYLVQTIDTKLPKNKLKWEGLSYKLIGLVPDEFNYEQGLLDLYLNQIGGYYDPEKKHFIMAAWMPAMLQTTVAVHELTHGLQDQHFNLERMMDPKIENGDLLLARSALVEGDANFVMLEQARKQAGQGTLRAEPNVDAFVMQNILGLSLMGGSAIPNSLQMMVLFPYTSGLRFVHYLIRQGGYSKVNAVFKKPPRSTEEILHPEKYDVAMADFKEYSQAELRGTEVPSEYQQVYVDTMGEFLISSLLGNFETDKRISALAAAGWGGDRLGIFEDSGKRIMVWRTNWDTPEDAAEFEKSFQHSLSKRISGYQPGAEQSLGSNRIKFITSGKEATLVIRGEG
ncbi:MAG: hypothetical protein K1X83_08485 [Oligoflexia bacterium]|nr:hypothetical protein [Oligoflexia bacterium]